MTISGARGTTTPRSGAAIGGVWLTMNNVNIRKNHSTNKSGPAGMNDLAAIRPCSGAKPKKFRGLAARSVSPDALGVVKLRCVVWKAALDQRIKAKNSVNKERPSVINYLRGGMLSNETAIQNFQFSFEYIIPNVFYPRHDRTPYFFKNFSGDWICTFDPGGQGSFDFAR